MNVNKSIILLYEAETTLVRLEQQRIFLSIATHKTNVAFIGLLKVCEDVFKDIKKQ